MAFPSSNVAPDRCKNQPYVFVPKQLQKSGSVISDIYIFGFVYKTDQEFFGLLGKEPPGL